MFLNAGLTVLKEGLTSLLPKVSSRSFSCVSTRLCLLAWNLSSCLAYVVSFVVVCLWNFSLTLVLASHCLAQPVRSLLLNRLPRCPITATIGLLSFWFTHQFFSLWPSFSLLNLLIYVPAVIPPTFTLSRIVLFFRVLLHLLPARFTFGQLLVFFLPSSFLFRRSLFHLRLLFLLCKPTPTLLTIPDQRYNRSITPPSTHPLFLLLWWWRIVFSFSLFLTIPW